MTKLKKIGYMAASLLFMSSDCKKESAECHRSVVIKNMSMDPVVVAFIAYYDNNCNVQGPVVEPSASYVQDMNFCWEEILANGSSMEFYIVNPNGYNNTLEYYDCDSVSIHNDVLMHFELNLSELQATNFIVTYP